MEDVERLKKKRKTFRAVVTKFVNKANTLLEAEEIDEKRLKQVQRNLKDSFDILSETDKEILDLMVDADFAEEDCQKEADDASEIEEKVTYALICLEEALSKDRKSSMTRSASQETVNSEANSSVASESGHRANRKQKVKLPKLELKKFGGKISEWQEFWDGFNSAIHEDTDLANVDKLKYLKSFLEEPAKNVIAGIPLTESNYQVAIDLLQKRYAKPSILKRAHMNELINLPPVFNERNIGRLKDLHDKIETQFRGLEALKIDKDSYSSIVVPVLMEKVPESIRLNMIRFAKDHLEWTVDQMAEALAKEIEIRESHVPIFKSPQQQQQNVNNRPRRTEQQGTTATASALFSSAPRKCVFCLEDHLAENCLKIKDPEERKKILLKYAKCFNCLNPGHRSFKCRNKSLCKNCQGKHHVALCNQKRVTNIDISAKPKDKDPILNKKESQPSSAPLNPEAASFVGQSSANDSTSGKRVALQTAVANVNGVEGSRVRVLFDTGSQKTFVTTRAAERLGLVPVRKEELRIKAFGVKEAEVKERDVYRFSLSPVIRSSSSVSIEAFAVNNISNIANQHVECIKKDYSHLKHVYFSDVSRSEENLEIDVLIGSDFLWNLQDGEIIRGGLNEPIAVKTLLGWTLSGPLKGEQLDFEINSDVIVNHLCDITVSPVLKQDTDRAVHRLWDLDSVGVREDNEVHESVVDDIVFTGDRYSVGLPWKVGHKPLPSNYQTSLSRLKSQVRKLKQNPDVLKEYDSIIKGQLVSGIIEQVSEFEGTDHCHYLPHQAVCREDVETTKVRVVYDASCKDRKRGVSLNECLHVGPSLTPLIFDILLRFRLGKVALVSDIEKAFLNIDIHPKDRDYLRFLWIDDIHASDPKVLTFRFNRVVFGVTSSPFLLNAVLRHHIQTYRECDPDFVRQMIESFFVDDLVTSNESDEKAYELYNKARVRVEEGGFRLRKWKTNDKVLAAKIVESESKIVGNKEKAEDSYAKETLGFPTEKGSKTKVLGVAWDTEQDKLEIDFCKAIKTAKEVPTKRGILSTLASVFDPMGLVSPVSVSAKMLFQELCVEKYEWDDPLPEDKSLNWQNWLKDLSNVNGILLPRFILDSVEGEIVRTTLHGFGDASQKAYCAMIFVECETTKGIYTKLLCAKTRVAPLKPLSIPRLELMSARILVTLMDTVKQAISSYIEVHETKYWLDSKTALFWINNNGEWKTFVQHRVNEILRVSEKEDWGHVAGVDNPADLGSRGVSASFLRDCRKWWEGPEWLKKGKENWPKHFLFEDSEEIGNERKKDAVTMLATNTEVGVKSIIDIDRYSSLNRLMRVTAYVKRFIKNLRYKKEGRELISGRVRVEELREAELIWIKQAQSILQQDPDFKKYKEQLGIVDENGILVCKGRLENADLDIETKYPMILPRNHKFTEMVVLDCHQRVHHCKVKGTLAEIRARFWITRGRQYVKRIIRNCFICKKMEGNPFNPPVTSALPGFRVTEAPPFSKVGVDFAGPLYVRVSKNVMNKVYIVLFTCCVTRALHLELVSEISAPMFVNCLRRFCSRRGTPTLIVSDNAKTFKATSKLLRKLQSDNTVSECLEMKRIVWRFNLERSPWMGGVFERMVQSVKRCLRKVLGNAKLSFDELSTVLTEIESTLNSRPLTYQYETEQVLTPSHLIFGRRLMPVSYDIEPNVEINECTNDALSKRFLYLSRKLNHFWSRWSKEYLTDLREQHKLKNTTPGLVRKGDVVLVYDENTKRGQWKIGIIKQLIIGKDGQVRGASVRMNTKGKSIYLNRPLQKLYPLEITGDSDKDPEPERKVERVSDKSGERMSQEGSSVPRGMNRVPRAAAIDARWKAKLLLDS